jgi:hypothetical protein
MASQASFTLSPNTSTKVAPITAGDTWNTVTIENISTAAVVYVTAAGTANNTQALLKNGVRLNPGGGTWITATAGPIYAVSNLGATVTVTQL